MVVEARDAVLRIVVEAEAKVLEGAGEEHPVPKGKEIMMGRPRTVIVGTSHVLVVAERVKSVILSMTKQGKRNQTKTKRRISLLLS